MVNYTPILLSESDDGRGILIAANATPGTLIHTTDLALLEFVNLWAINTSGSNVKITIEYGGTGTGDIIETTILPEGGLMEITPRRMMLTGGKEIRIFADAINVISVHGGAVQVEVIP